MAKIGWNGQILWIDLTTKTTRVETIPPEVYESFIGGKGLGAYLLYNSLKPKTDPKED